MFTLVMMLMRGRRRVSVAIGKVCVCVCVWEDVSYVFAVTILTKCCSDLS